MAQPVPAVQSAATVLTMPVPSRTLHLKLLGFPQVSIGDIPVTFARRKALALLAYLAVTGRPHSREAIADLMVDEGTDRRAYHQVRNLVYDLRRLLGEYVVLGSQTITFNRALPYTLDVERFTAALEASDTATLEHAVSLYDGEFLAGFTPRGAPQVEAWLMQQRVHLHILLVGALERLLDGAVRSGDEASAIQHADRLVRLEPWRKEVHRHLMDLLARTGQSDAVARHEAGRANPAAEVGAAPDSTARYDPPRPRATGLPAGAPTVVRRGHCTLLRGDACAASAVPRGSGIGEGQARAGLGRAAQCQAQIQDLPRELEAISSLQPAFDPAALADLSLEQLCAIVPARAAALLLLDGDHLVVAAYRGPLPRERVRGKCIPLAHAGYGELARRRKALIANDPQAAIPRGAADRDGIPSLSGGRAGAQLAAPLLVGARLVGVVQLEATPPHRYMAWHADLAVAVATQAAAALHSARLFARAQDAVTAMLGTQPAPAQPARRAGAGG